MRTLANFVPAAAAAKPSPWGRWRGAALLRCTVTDEVSPPLAGLTSAFTFAILWLAAVAASAPSEGFGFRAPPVADTTPQSFRLVKQAEKPAPLTQGSREARSVFLGNKGGAMRRLRHVRGNEKIFPQHLKL